MPSPLSTCEISGAISGLGPLWTRTQSSFPCWYVGTRDAGAAYHFIHDLKDRLANRVQLTTDGHKAYLSAVEDAFGSEVDYAMLQKIYGTAPEGSEIRYSPAQCMGARRAVISAMPETSTHFNQPYRTPEPDNADVQAPVYAPNKRIFKEG